MHIVRSIHTLCTMTPEPPDGSLDEQIAQAAARNRELAAHHHDLTAKEEASERRVAYYQHLVQQNKRMEHEIAAMEGRRYHDEDDPYADGPGEIPGPEDD